MRVLLHSSAQCGTELEGQEGTGATATATTTARATTTATTTARAGVVLLINTVVSIGKHISLTDWVSD